MRRCMKTSGKIRIWKINNHVVVFVNIANAVPECNVNTIWNSSKTHAPPHYPHHHTSLNVMRVCVCVLFLPTHHIHTHTHTHTHTHMIRRIGGGRVAQMQRLQQCCGARLVVGFLALQQLIDGVRHQRWHGPAGIRIGHRLATGALLTTTQFGHVGGWRL